MVENSLRLRCYPSPVATPHPFGYAGWLVITEVIVDDYVQWTVISSFSMALHMTPDDRVEWGLLWR